MKTPFRLDDHPRRQPPLASPPDKYFDQLPLRIMQRVQPVAPAPDYALRPGLGWLRALPAPLRTVLAATVVLAGFAGSFFLSDPATTATRTPSVDASLAGVSHTEMVEYLLASELRVTLADLAELPATDQVLPESYLQASPAEVQEALDAQPTEEFYL